MVDVGRVERRRPEHAADPPPATARAWLAFAACGAIWGSTFLAISFGNDALAPVWAATLRLALATVLLTAWTRARGRALPRGPALRAALGYGVTQFGVNLPLLYWGETRRAVGPVGRRVRRRSRCRARS